MRLHIIVSIFAFLTAVLPVQFAHAQAMRISVSGPEIITLSEDATSVFVGNPEYITVTMDNPRNLIVIPKSEGMTNLTVLGQTGNVIFNRSIIVGGPQNNYIRIQKICANVRGDCAEFTTYYCEEGQRCQDVSSNIPDSLGRGGPAASMGAMPPYPDASGAGTGADNSEFSAE